MRVGIDIDGVLYPWHDSIYRYFREYEGFTGNVREFWTMFRNMSEEKITYYVYLPHLYLNTFPTQDVLTYVPKIAEKAEIFYITAREPHLQIATEKFFKIYDLPFKENLIFSKNKVDYVRLLGLDYFLDDQPHHLIPMMDVTKSYLFKSFHNWEQREGFNVVSSMKEFYEVLA